MEIKRTTKFSATLVIAFLFLAACSQSAGIDSSAPAQGADPSSPGTVPEAQDPDGGNTDGDRTDTPGNTGETGDGTGADTGSDTDGGTGTPTDPDTPPPVVTWTVTYDGNNPVGGTVPVAQDVVDGESVTVASNSGSLSKTGYAFSGWNTKSDGTGIDYQAGSGSITPTGDIVLYARWLSTAPVAEWAQIQWPTDPTVSPRTTVSVYAQVYSSSGTSHEVVLIVGNGTDDSRWVEVAASFNKMVGNNKEYVATIDSSVIGELAVGTYSFSFKIREPGSVWFYVSKDSSSSLTMTLPSATLLGSLIVTN